MNTNLAASERALDLCGVDDLVPGGGVAALVEGDQIALYYLPNEKPNLYAVGNFDPIGKANVMSRGIIGDIDGRLVVASPLYKQHFDLLTGECLEQPEHQLPTYHAEICNGRVLLQR